MCRGTEGRGEVVGGESGAPGAVVVCTQRCRGHATGLTDGEKPFGEGVDGACGGMTTACVTIHFAPFTIFLIVEGEGGVCSPVQVRLGCGGGVQFLVPGCEGNMAQAQGVVVRGMEIFSGAQQQEEGDPNHFDGGGKFGRGSGEDESRGVVDDLDWEGFNAMWSRIIIGVGGVQPREPGSMSPVDVRHRSG